MGMRKPTDRDLLGKTIYTIDTKSTNVLRLNFTDGTSLELWAEMAVYTPCGSIPGIFVEDPTIPAEVEETLCEKCEDVHYPHCPE